MDLPKRRYIYIAAAVLALLVLAYFAMFREEAVKVEAGLVSRGELIESVNAEGRTRYHDRFTVTAPVSGKMVRVTLQEGDRIPKGYVLTHVDPNPPRPLDPTTTPDTGAHPYAYNVYSPVDGILTKVFISSEGIVQAGTPIAEVSKPSQLEIVADVLSADATRIRSHMPVLVENWGGDGSLHAIVRTVEPQAFTKISALGVEEQRVNIVADFLKPPDRLGDKYRVDVRVILWEGKDVLRVPESSLFRLGDSWNVFVLESGKARVRRVELGHRSPSYAEVLGGLNEGETVILHPPNSVGDGSRVDAK